MRKFALLMIIVSVLFLSTGCMTNRLNSRVFNNYPSLHYSTPQVESVNFENYCFSIETPVDKINEHQGEIVYKGIKTGFVTKFLNLPFKHEIRNKMLLDFSYLGVSESYFNPMEVIDITSDIEVFYPHVNGSLWNWSMTKIRLNITVSRNGIVLLQKPYEAFYRTYGLDKEFEGSFFMTIEQGASVTAGMALRMTLDQFYADLYNVLENE